MGLYRGLFSDKRKREYTDRELFSRYIKRIIPHKKSILLISVFILITTIADITLPLIVGFVVVEFDKLNTDIYLVMSATVFYLILSTVIWIMFSLRRREIGNFIPFFLEKLRLDIFD